MDGPARCGSEVGPEGLELGVRRGRVWAATQRDWPNRGSIPRSAEALWKAREIYNVSLTAREDKQTVSNTCRMNEMSLRESLCKDTSEARALPVVTINVRLTRLIDTELKGSSTGSPNRRRTVPRTDFRRLIAQSPTKVSRSWGPRPSFTSSPEPSYSRTRRCICVSGRRASS